MDQTKQHGVHQQAHGVIHRNKPCCLDQSCRWYIYMEKGPCNYINGISKVSSEQHAPGKCGKSTVHKHFNCLVHPLFHTGKLFQYDKTTQEHNQSIGSVRQHQSEEKYIEERHNKCRVYFSFLRKTIGTQNTFHGF